MRVRPLTPDGLVDHLSGVIAQQHPGGYVRVAVDGAPPTDPGRLADALVGPLRAHGRPALRVRAQAFLRPASLRFEHGREDPDAYYEDWLDVSGLDREVLAPLGPGGSGRYLPSLWDPVTDRATRAAYELAPPGSVLLLDGALLLGRWLDLDLTVHLAVRPATLARRTPEEARWSLPAYERYADEADPESTADVVVRVDDPRHPALVEPSGAPG
ncbi:nucleoside/nucleotide kinase family protein [Motilibacter aurantiacus]|uniref:uridine kinase n=1 Tax=Motilibacter aurantiacus TaxID=2714955 RepID=UPI00140DB954|nr:uridine kinase [Motilibacter aurantiacus]NHC44444.1 uridine kinase [Motilibacter aurantiacus]